MFLNGWSTVEADEAQALCLEMRNAIEMGGAGEPNNGNQNDPMTPLNGRMNTPSSLPNMPDDMLDTPIDFDTEDTNPGSFAE